MKKLIIIIVAALIGITVAYSQDIQTNQENITTSNNDYARNRLFIYGSGGYSNNIYDRIDNSFMYANYSFDLALELRYAYFFKPQWGVSVGAGISRFNAKGTLSIAGVIPQYNDPSFDTGGNTYDLYYQTDKLVEKQTIYALEVPIQVHFEHHIGEKGNGIFASLGAKGYFPVSAQSVFSQGTLTTKGYEAFTNTWYTDPPHFGTKDVSSTPSSVKLNPYTVDAIADFGGIFRINRKCDFYAGVYGSYGFMDILPKNGDKTDVITTGANGEFTANSLLKSNFLGEYNKYIANNNLDWKKADEKWNRWQVGIKIGFHLNFFTKKQESERVSSKEVSNDNQCTNNKEAVRDTVVVVVNLYNNAPDTIKCVQEHVNRLDSVLNSGKIYFDLNSDVPQPFDKNLISDAIAILQTEPASRLIIEGYACQLGTEKYNKGLALRRANAISNLFVEQGVTSELIQMAGYTYDDPESKLNIPDETLEAHRVVIFKIVKKGNL